MDGLESNMDFWRTKKSYIGWGAAESDITFLHLIQYNFSSSVKIHIGRLNHPLIAILCPKNSLYSMFLSAFLMNLYDVIFRTIKSGGVTSRCCDVMPCGITTLWHDVITTGVGGNPQRNHNSTKVILDGTNMGMIQYSSRSMGAWSDIQSGFRTVGQLAIDT
jgi:hypothetical protein